ncbi:MAG: hypothetical protein ACM3ZQ_07430 [Bacillota bacterium]
MPVWFVLWYQELTRMRSSDSLSSRLTPTSWLSHQSDFADLMLDHERYKVYLNDMPVGRYEAFGDDRAPQSIERRLVDASIIPTGTQVVGNRIIIICEGTQAEQAAYYLNLLLMGR